MSCLTLLIRNRTKEAKNYKILELFFRFLHFSEKEPGHQPVSLPANAPISLCRSMSVGLSAHILLWELFIPH